MTQTPDELVRAVEATLFAAEEPMTAEALSAHLAGADVRGALDALEAHYRERGIRLVERGGRWQFQTAPDLAHLLRREREQVRKLSRAALRLRYSGRGLCRSSDRTGHPPVRGCAVRGGRCAASSF